MTIDYALRRLESADAAAFLALRQRALHDHPEAYSSTAEEWNVPVSHAVERIQSNLVLGALVGNALVGMVTVALMARPRLKQRHKTEIWSVYVAPEYWGNGLAKALMLLAIDEVKQLGFVAVTLSVADGNEKALRLYENLGFVKYGTEPDAIRLPETGQLIANHHLNLDLRSV